jgi:GTP-binding protein
VGKSTLFNRLTKSRDAIVADFGLARPPLRPGPPGREYIVIDTGGFEPTAESGIYKEMAKQTRQAVAEADAVIFIVDARAGLSAQDHDIANYLRRLGKPCLLVANKAEGMTEARSWPSSTSWAWARWCPSRPPTARACAACWRRRWTRWRCPRREGDEPEDDGSIRLAVAGRPNVGKSTLINTWLGEERLVAFDMPGTTRDAIACPSRAGRSSLIDTAGLRRKGKVFEAIEKFSVVKTCRPSSRPTSCCCCWTPRRA